MILTTLTFAGRSASLACNHFRGQLFVWLNVCTVQLQNAFVLWDENCAHKQPSAPPIPGNHHSVSCLSLTSWGTRINGGQAALVLWCVASFTWRCALKAHPCCGRCPVPFLLVAQNEPTEWLYSSLLIFCSPWVMPRETECANLALLLYFGIPGSYVIRPLSFWEWILTKKFFFQLWFCSRFT